MSEYVSNSATPMRVLKSSGGPNRCSRKLPFSLRMIERKNRRLSVLPSLFARVSKMFQELNFTGR